MRVVVPQYLATLSFLHALSALVAARIMNMTGLLEHVSIPARKMLPLSLVTAAAVGSGSGTH